MVAKSISGTFAFYIKGKRASPPGAMTQQAEARPVTLRPKSLDKARRSESDGLSGSPSQPIQLINQGKDDPRKIQVLLVEDNIVNRKDLLTLPDLFGLTID